MKKRLFLCLASAALLLCLASCTHEHTASEWTLNRDASCFAIGLRVKTCTDCGAIVDEEIIPTIEHTVVFGDSKEPTCTEAGYTAAESCSFCYAVIRESVEIPALGHTSVSVEAKAPTCTEDGYTESEICSVCEEILVASEIVEKLGHDIEYVEGTPATCTEPGYTYSESCKTCKTVLYERQDVPSKGHEWVTKYAKNPTCSEDGNTEGIYCYRCSEWKVESEKIDKLPHTPIEVAEKPATCTEPGYRAGVRCTVCNNTISGLVNVPAKGHDFDILTNSCKDCFTLEYPEIKTRNDFLEIESSTEEALVVYLDYIIDPNGGYYYYIPIDASMTTTDYYRFVGTPGVVYPFYIDIKGRTEDIRFDFVNVTLKLNEHSLISSSTEADIHIGFYGTECGFVGSDGQKGDNRTLLNTSSKKGGAGYEAITMLGGDLTITVGCTNTFIKGGNGGAGGNGMDAGVTPMNGTNAANGGDGARAIVASSITVNFVNGFSADNVVIEGGKGGAGGKGGKGFVLFKDGKDGDNGADAPASNVAIEYR